MMVLAWPYLNDWIYDTLSGDATLVAWATGGIWRGAAPQGTTGNLVLYAQQGSSDRKAVPYQLVLVRAYSPGNSLALVEDAAQRINTLMLDTVPVTGVDLGDIVMLPPTRDQELPRDDAEWGVPGTYLGAIYRLTYTPSTS